MEETNKRVIVNKPPKRNRKLYLAVLNKGWIRRELYPVIDDIRKTPGVETYVEPFTKTFANPIFVNRNRIAKRFLEHKPRQDFLLMLDNDVIPRNNPAELIFANQDIIGMPAKVRQRGRSMNWVAYVKHPYADGYFAVDFENIDDSTDLLDVDAIGTGCILIKRKVIEKLFKESNGNGWDAPFTIDLTPDGDSMHGTDFAFCIRAKKHGFKIFTTPQRICEHVKEVGLLDIKGYDDCDGRDELAGRYQIPWTDFSIAQLDWWFIREIMEKENIRSVLEFGSGLSTLLMSELAEVHTLETDDEWIETVEKEVARVGNRSVLVKKWTGRKRINTPMERYDMAFIDGPKGKGVEGGFGREASFQTAVEHTDRIIVHDAGRTEEQELQRKYLRKQFRLKKKNGWHQARCQYWEKKV